MKVVVIGLDGAPYELLRKWVDAGILPHLSNMAKIGVFTKLISTIPPKTPSAWVSLMTGKNPGKHGIFGFEKRLRKSYNFITTNSTHIGSKTIWGIISEKGGKCVVLHVPITYPPEKINGIMISSPKSPGGIYPAETERELLSAIKEYKTSPKIYPFGEEKDLYLKELHKVTEKIGEEAIYFLERYSPDFFMTVFYWGDQLQHAFWKYIDPDHPYYDLNGAKRYGQSIQEYYKKIDKIIGRILEHVDQNTIFFIVSDHGHRSNYKEVLVNNLLHEIGVLNFKTKSKKNDNSFIIRIVEILLKNIYMCIQIAPFDKLIDIYKKLPSSILRRIFPIVNNRLRAPFNPIFPYIDWSKTKAYATEGGCFFYIFINLQGREPDGVVKPRKEYEELRSYLFKAFHTFKDEEKNEKIIKKVFKREEIYSGPYVGEAPDLICLLNEGYNSVTNEIGKSIRYPKTVWTSNHSMNGILFIRGSSLREIDRITVNIVDLAPTILHAMDIPIPSDMDGRVLEEIFQDKKEVKKTSEPSTKKREEYFLSPEEERKTVDRLRRLGYM